MLSFITAPSGYGKTHTIINRINKLLDESDKKIFVIVPEQESVKMEAELLTFCGNRINKNVEVINFTRLANRVFRESGGMTYRYIDTAGKDLITAVILEKLKSSCPAFSKVLDDTRYIRTLRAEMDALRSRGYHASDIEKAAVLLFEEDKGGASLREKLSDFSTAFMTYEKSLKDNTSDTTDDVARLALTLDDYDFFEDSHVFIDGFYDYTVPQYDVMERIMKSADSMTVTLSLRLPDTEEVFRKTSEAYKTLRERAEKNSIEYVTETLDTNYRSQNENLKALAEAVMSGEDIKAGDSDGVKLVSAATPYDECVYVAREIVRLVKNGASFSEIAICAANVASYSSDLENVLGSYGVSHLSCTENTVMRMPIISLVMSALDVINSSFYSKHMKSYLKSPYLDLTEEEAYMLENYVTLWNIGKKNWYSDSDWTLHPRGYSETRSSRDERELAVVNRARHKIFTPLKKLAEGFSDRSTVREKASALVGFFDLLGLSSKVESHNRELAEAFGEADYDDEISAWNSLLNALDMLVEGAGELAVGRDRFIKYFALILSDMSFGKIPSSLDEVEIGDVEFVRNKGIKHLFFLGFNDGVFPSAGDARSVFTENERRWLRESGIKLTDSPEEKLKDQSFQFLLALLRPSHTVDFVYHTSSSEGAKAHSLPSYYSQILEDVLGTKSEQADLSSPVSKSELRNIITESDDDLSALFESEEEKEFYGEALTARAFAKSAAEPFHIDTDRDLLPDGTSLTQSRLEKYIKCRFSYFAEYMLRAKPREPAEFGRAEIGSYVHKILEEVLSSVTKHGRSINDITDEEIASYTLSSAASYIERTAPNINEDSPKYKYLVENICAFVLLVVENIRAEFETSLFKPSYFEENIETSEAVKPYSVTLRDGSVLLFRGVIDRVDTYVDADGAEYIRVVDYKTKTGGKSFSLEDVLNGINLQMLIYLYAFTNTPSDRERREAGIMYMPASKEELKASDSEIPDDKLREQIDKSLMRSGMYIDDAKIIDAMESGENKRFIGLKFDSKSKKYKGSAEATLATFEEFGIVKRYIDMLFCDVAESIKGGYIEANPIEDDNAEHTACAYCKFHPICRFEGETREKIRSKLPLVKMQAELGETAEEEE